MNNNEAFRRSVVAAVLACVFFAICAPLWSQSRQSYLDQRSVIILPDNYDSRLTYPLIVGLPWTGGTAEEFFLYYQDVLEDVPALLLLPPGRPQRNHYLPDFLSFVGWYDQRVMTDLNDALDSYAIDPERVYLMGYSLGGDLAWALMNRNPRVFRGAAMFGTRCSYPTSEQGFRYLVSREARAFFGIGDQEDPARSRGIQAAYRSVSSVGISARLAGYAGAHTNPNSALVAQALDFLALGGGQPTAETPPSTPEVDAPPAKEFDQWTREAESWFDDSFDFSVPDDWDSWSFDEDDFFGDETDFFD